MTEIACTACGDPGEASDEGERCGMRYDSRLCDGTYEVAPEWCCVSHEYGRSTLEPCRKDDGDD